MGFRLEREMRFAGSRRGTTLKLGQSYLGAHSRYQALFVLAIRYVAVTIAAPCLRTAKMAKHILDMVERL